MNSDLLCDRVQHNCNIADARHAANYTLCTYLMKMREYYRWEQGYSYDTVLQKEQVGDWVSQREELWDTLEEADFEAVEVNGQSFDPFDTHAINEVLETKGMVYSGGLGHRAAPHFFLGKLAQTHRHDDYRIIVSSEECARDLGAPPAMTLGKTIFIRQESIRRMLWEKVQEWQWHRHQNAMATALSFYDFDAEVDVSLNNMTENELNAVVLHEIGEINSSNMLGAYWKEMLVTIDDMHLELSLRAIKDLLADSISTLPKLLDDQREASVHFLAGNMSALRKKLSPSFMPSYQKWSESGDAQVLHRWAVRSGEHWQKVASHIMQMHEHKKTAQDIELYISQNYF